MVRLPGYVGYDEAGQLTEKVRRRPYSVLLFDEIEKAHPDVLNILLQILDEGRITDAHGRTVNFENTVIVMTSNAGSERQESALGFAQDRGGYEPKEKAMKVALLSSCGRSSSARIDEVVVFRPLDVADFQKIAGLMLNEYVGTLKEKGITLTYTPEVCGYLAEKSIHGQSGARDLRNNIRRMVEDKLAMLLVEKGEGSLTGVNLSHPRGRIETGNHVNEGGRRGGAPFFREKSGKPLDRGRGRVCYNNHRRKMRGCSSMVESQPSKLVVWVRFPSPAPNCDLRQ